MAKPNSEDLALIGSLTRELNQRRRRHDELDKAYRGERQVEMIGLAAPERLRGFEFPGSSPRWRGAPGGHRRGEAGAGIIPA